MKVYVVYTGNCTSDDLGETNEHVTDICLDEDVAYCLVNKYVNWITSNYDEADCDYTIYAMEPNEDELVTYYDGNNWFRIDVDAREGGGTMRWARYETKETTDDVDISGIRLYDAM